MKSKILHSFFKVWKQFFQKMMIVCSVCILFLSTSSLIAQSFNYVPFVRTGSLGQFDPNQCVDDIVVSWGTISGTWTPDTGNVGTLTTGAGTNIGQQVCYTGGTNDWHTTFNNATPLPATSSGCITFTVPQDQYDGHFIVGLWNPNGTSWGTGTCQVYIEGNTLNDQWRVISVVDQPGDTPISTGWQSSNWTFPMTFDACYDATTEEFFVNFDANADGIREEVGRGDACFVPCEEVSIQQIRRITDPAPPVASYSDFGPTPDCKVSLTFDFKGCDGNPVSTSSTVNVEMIAAGSNGTYSPGTLIASGTYNYGSFMQGNLQNDNNWNGTGTSGKVGGYWLGQLTDGSTVTLDRIDWREDGSNTGDIPVTFRYQLVDPACCASAWREVTFGRFFATTTDNRGPDTSSYTLVGNYYEGPTYPVYTANTFGVGAPTKIHQSVYFGGVCGSAHTATMITPSTAPHYTINQIKVDGVWITLGTPIPVADAGGGVGYGMGEIFNALKTSAEILAIFKGNFCMIGQAAYNGTPSANCVYYQSNWSVFITYESKLEGFRFYNNSGVLMGEWTCTDASGDFGG